MGDSSPESPKVIVFGLMSWQRQSSDTKLRKQESECDGFSWGWY